MSKRNKISVPKPSAEQKEALRAQKALEKARKKESRSAQKELNRIFRESNQASKKKRKAQKQAQSAEQKSAPQVKEDAAESFEPVEIAPDPAPAEPESAAALKEDQAAKKPDQNEEKAQKKLARREKKARIKQERRARKALKPKQAEKPQKVLTPKELRAQELRARRRVYFAAWSVVTLFIYLALAGLIVVGIYFSIWMTDSGVDNTTQTSMRVVAQSENGKSRKTVRCKQENGTFYLPITLIDQYGDYVHAGDFGARTIQFSESGESAVFAINSPFCTINGISLNLQKPVLLSDGELYLPLDFYLNYLTGLDFEKSGSGYEIQNTDHPLGYTLKPATASANVPEEEAGSLLEFATKTPDFASDLSAYERYMNPGETTEYLTLVNSHHGLSETYRPDDLTGVEDQNAAYPGGDYHAKLRLFASKSLDAMLQEARANGFDGLQATSGYRTYAEQNYRFNSMVTSLRAKGMGQAEAEAEAMRSVHRPGYSEYQTGLAVDVRYPGESIDEFKDTSAAAWLAENAYKFGFILRYPQSKEAITGMDYQAWHFRYVGRYHAIRIKYLDMSLEEYIDFMEIETG